MNNGTSNNDAELMAQLFHRISLGAAAGADALLAAGMPGTTALVQWLTDAATGMAQASTPGIVLRDEDRAMVQEYLRDGRISR